MTPNSSEKGHQKQSLRIISWGQAAEAQTEHLREFRNISVREASEIAAELFRSQYLSQTQLHWACAKGGEEWSKIRCKNSKEQKYQI